MSQGIRHNEGKPQWSQIHWKSLEPMVRVLEQGEKVVGKSNWKKGLPVLEVCESLLRHTFALMDGEDNDQKSGQPHVGHILANAMFLSYMMQFRPDMDNRDGKQLALSADQIKEMDQYRHDRLMEMLNSHGITYEQWCNNTEGLSEEEKSKILMSSIPRFWQKPEPPNDSRNASIGKSYTKDVDPEWDRYQDTSILGRSSFEKPKSFWGNIIDSVLSPKND